MYILDIDRESCAPHARMHAEVITLLLLLPHGDSPNICQGSHDGGIDTKAYIWPRSSCSLSAFVPAAALAASDDLVPVELGRLVHLASPLRDVAVIGSAGIQRGRIRCLDPEYLLMDLPQTRLQLLELLHFPWGALRAETVAYAVEEPLGDHWPRLALPEDLVPLARVPDLEVGHEVITQGLILHRHRSRTRGDPFADQVRLLVEGELLFEGPGLVQQLLVERCEVAVDHPKAPLVLSVRALQDALHQPIEHVLGVGEPYLGALQKARPLLDVVVEEEHDELVGDLALALGQGRGCHLLPLCLLYVVVLLLHGRVQRVERIDLGVWVELRRPLDVLGRLHAVDRGLVLAHALSQVQHLGYFERLVGLAERSPAAQNRCC
mmetsp:Transcript_26027/g.50635  ORF Transcript_26027/g.50635 Transcript_26027/m.50635 type:complete len:379 (-) Transcript_26027:1896-3032(-)